MGIIDNSKQKNQIAHYHLPGLFEFYDLYSVFLPLFYEHREYFYDWCDVGSIYGAPYDCLWSGGRTECSDTSPEDVLNLMRKYNISSRLTFSNSLLREEHLTDKKCNELCRLFDKTDGSCKGDERQLNGIIICSDLLLDYLQEHYSGFYFVSSTTKVLDDFGQLLEEIQRDDFRYVVPDFRLNKEWEQLNNLSDSHKDKVEFLCNECCWFYCQDRKICYEDVSHKNLGDDVPEHICHSPGGSDGYRFSKAMENPGFIGIDDIIEKYMPMGFSNFKIEGRGLGSAMILEFLLYYMVKPEYQIHVREAVYLDNTLDLF